MTSKRYLFLIFGLSALFLGGCQGRSGATTGVSLIDEAAQQATAIVQQAQATALVLQAQAKATAVVAQADAFAPTPGSSLVVVNGGEGVLPTPAPSVQEKEEPLQTVEIVRVGMAADGGFIIIQFRAPPKEADKWWQGNVQAINEETQSLYNEIPVMPNIGLLIGRPQQYGQIGFIMLVNPAPQLKPGDTVTVILGEYQFEHVPVE